jgi:hypothetical protein
MIINKINKVSDQLKLVKRINCFHYLNKYFNQKFFIIFLLKMFKNGRYQNIKKKIWLKPKTTLEYLNIN